MPTQVIAVDGDCLCTIAIRNGYQNCDRLRADGANGALLDRPLRAGDIVTVPDREENVLQRPDAAVHAFVRRGVPEPSIRVVHGSRDRAFADDATLGFLNIDNYVPNRAGINGNEVFPTGFGFDRHADADLDSFKVEVVDARGGASVMLELEAMKPVYNPAGAVVRHEPFAGGDVNSALRKIRVQARKVSGGSSRYRSRYLRLVADEVDFAALSGNPPRADGSAQGLLVSDMADGNDGAADRVEILDQVVRASYVLPRCTAAAPHQCQLSVTLPIAPDKQRIRLCFHVFRTVAGTPGARFGGVTDQALRLRTAKWYRRTFAQAGLAPILVGPKIEELDPPPADMLVISQPAGNLAVGQTDAGTVSSLSFDLEVLPIGAGPPTAPVAVSLNLGALVAANGGAALTPQELATAIIGRLPAGFAGRSFAVQPGYANVGAPVDVVITHTSGGRVIIRNEVCDDSGATVTVARVNLGSLATAVADFSDVLPPWDPTIRRVCRAGTSTDDRMDCFVIARWTRGGLRGLALIPDQDLPATHHAVSPVNWANIMAMSCDSDAAGPFGGAAIATLDGTDSLPYTYPHESGHVMMDAIHATNTTELMRSGTSEQNELRGSKRLCDHPVTIPYQLRGPHTIPGGAVVTAAISAVERLRARGAQVMQPW